MNGRISLNGNDWLFKDFYGEDWRWRNSHLPDSRELDLLQLFDSAKREAHNVFMCGNFYRPAYRQ